MLKFFSIIWFGFILLMNIAFYTNGKDTPSEFLILINLVMIYFFFLIFTHEFR